MKAFTLTQPWASLIALLLKTFETRSWRTAYTGPLLIHASREVDKYFINSPIGQRYNMPGLWTPDDPIPTKAIVALCELKPCVPTQPLPPGLSKEDYDLGDWSTGRWAWPLVNIIPLPEPIPCRGSLNVWTPPDYVLQQVAEMLNISLEQPASYDGPLRLPMTDAAGQQSRMNL